MNLAPKSAEKIRKLILKEPLMGSTPMGSARKLFFVRNVTFRVQTAPFDKATMDFSRFRKHLYIPDLLKAKKSSVRSTFLGGSVFMKRVTFQVQTAPFDK